MQYLVTSGFYLSVCLSVCHTLFLGNPIAIIVEGSLRGRHPLPVRVSCTTLKKCSMKARVEVRRDSLCMHVNDALHRVFIVRVL